MFDVLTITNVDQEAMTALIEETGQVATIIRLETASGTPATWATAHRMILTAGDDPDDILIYADLEAAITVH